MPSVTLPLVGMPNRRAFRTSTGALTKDQRYIGIMHTFVENAATNSRTVYAEKREGFFANEIASGAGAGKFAFSPTFSSNANSIGTVYQFGSTIYEGADSRGVLDGTTPQVMYCAEAEFSGTVFVLLTVVASGPTTSAYFLAGDARTSTFTGNFSSGNATVSNVSSFTGLYVGMKLSTVGAQVPADTRIASLNPGGSSLVMTNNAGANGTGTTITPEQIAKIIDANFPATSIVGGFVVVNGRAYIQTISGGIYGSESNNPASWTSSNLIQANYEPDEGSGLTMMGNNIAALGANGVQFFYDAGNASGSVLSPARNLIRGSGCNNTRTFHQYCRWGDDVYFLGNISEDFSVYRLRNGELTTISDDTVSGLGQAQGDRTIQAFSFAGRNYLLLQINNAATGSMLYDIERGFWCESGFPQFYHVTKRMENSAGAVSPAGTSGNRYFFGNTWTDDGAAYTATIQMAPVDLGGGKPVTITSAELMGDTQSSGTASFEISTDDYANFTSVGSFDMTADRKIVHRCGYSRSGRIIPRITHSANTAFRAQALRLEFEVGA